MEKRNITITLEKAIEWFNSKDATLKDIALQAFSVKELEKEFKLVKTFKDACNALGIIYDSICQPISETRYYSRASVAMFKLNIIKKALNLNKDLHLTKDPKDSLIYYPCNPIITKNSFFYIEELNSGKMEIIGKIKSEGEEYNVLGGTVDYNKDNGLSNFNAGMRVDVASASATIGFFGCANKEIAEHFGKYFGMLITEAKYGDLYGFIITEDKYGNAK